jgi:threonine dehydratase
VTHTRHHQPAQESKIDHEIPTLVDVLAARVRIAPYLNQTALYTYPALTDLVGAEVSVKHENHQPVGAFKVRGGVNLVAQLSTGERQRGLIAASTGNHGQSVAYAARLFSVAATICVPEGANPVKVASMRALGAQVLFDGRDFDEARERCEQLAIQHGYRYVHSGNEPQLIAGVATATLEILEQQPDVDTIIVPVGGGSGAAAACIAGKSIKPTLQVIGVQSEAAPAAYRSWKERRLVEDQMKTFAEGLATRVGFELTQHVLWDKLDDFVLVSDDEIRAAMLSMIEGTRNLVEAAGASPLAAALRLRSQLAGKRVALMCTGGNVTLAQLKDALTAAATFGSGLPSEMSQPAQPAPPMSVS